MFIPKNEKEKRIKKVIEVHNGQIPLRQLSDETEINYPTLKKMVEELNYKLKKSEMATKRKMLVVYS